MRQLLYYGLSSCDINKKVKIRENMQKNKCKIRENSTFSRVKNAKMVSKFVVDFGTPDLLCLIQFPANITRNQQVHTYRKEGSMEYHKLFGARKTKDEVINELKMNADVYRGFQKLSRRLQTEFIEFCMGLRSLNITYDPVFKKVFDPTRVPERLEEFLSLCLGEKLKILRVVPNESERLTEGGSLLVMDILVQLESGALVNIEIQKVGYLFPGARCACYSSDLVMRQYSQVREQKRKENEPFSYKDIKKVYTIVLIQKSTEEFRTCPEHYLHYSRQRFDTGLELDMLQEYLLIPLDIFLQNRHNIDRKLDAWLYFIASDRLEDVCRVVEKYPEFWKLYEEVFQFRFQKEELISMYSDALRILDENTVQYMVEEQQELIEVQRQKISQNQQQLDEQLQQLEEQQQQLNEQSQQLNEQSQRLNEQTQQLNEQTQRLNEQTQQLNAQTQELKEQSAVIDSQAKALKQQEEEIERLRRLLAERG